MKRITISIVLLILVTGVGLAAWKIVPRQLERQAELQACRAVVDEMRRQIALPAEATFQPCEEVITVPSAEGDGWSVFGEYEMRRATSQVKDRYTFYGNAWRSEKGMEATIVVANQMNK